MRRGGLPRMIGVMAAASVSNERTVTADGSWMAWSVGGLVGLWTTVALVSIFAPDLVSGSEQQHLPVAAFATWLWGMVATGGYLLAMGRLRGSSSRRPIWIGLTVATLTVWLVATILSTRCRSSRPGPTHAAAHRRPGHAPRRRRAHRPGRHHCGVFARPPQPG